jgi:hypothetical protein
MNQKDFSKLLEKYLRGECTPEEEELILTWYHKIDEPYSLMEENERREVERRLWRKIKPGAAGKSTPWIFRIAGVFALFAAIFCIYVFVDHQPLNNPLAPRKQATLEKPTAFTMEYDGAPVKKIFDVLETKYDVDIVYDETNFASCVLTTSMTNESLYERLEIICKAINARYEIKESTIVITGNGCR